MNSHRSFAPLVAGLFSVASVFVAVRADYSGSYEDRGGKFSVSWTSTADTITYVMSAPTLGWIAMGWSMQNSGHSGTDIIVGWVDDTTAETTLLDTSSNAPGRPNEDGNNDITLISGTQDTTSTTITFSRPLTTVDAGNNDVDIVDDRLYLSWATGSVDGVDGAYTKHTSLGRQAVNFLGELPTRPPRAPVVGNPSGPFMPVDPAIPPSTTSSTSTSSANASSGGGVLPIVAGIAGVGMFAGVMMMAVKARRNRAAGALLPTMQFNAGFAQPQQPMPTKHVMAGYGQQQMMQNHHHHHQQQQQQQFGW